MANTNQKPKTSLFKSKTIWIIALLLIVGASSYFGVYRPRSIENDKQRFLTAETEIANLSDQIQAKIGKADQVAKDNSCGRANLKSSEGPLSCAVGIDLLYEDKNFNESNELMSKTKTFGSDSMTDGEFTNGDIRKLTQTFFQDISSIETLSCSFAYSYRDKNSAGGALSPKTDENFKLSISCSGPAEAEHYLIN